MGSIYVNVHRGRIAATPRRRQQRRPKWWSPERGEHLAQIMERVGEIQLPFEFASTVTSIARKVRSGEISLTADLAKALVAIKRRAGRKFSEAKAQALVDDIVAEWVREDRERDLDLWRLEQNQIHGEKGVFGRTFDPVERDVFLASRPSYYLVGHGVDPTDQHQVFARVRVPSTLHHLFVTAGSPTPKLSKNRRRKLRRYNGQEVGQADAEHDRLRTGIDEWWAK